MRIKGRLRWVTLLVKLSHMTPFHSQQSCWVDHENSTPAGSLIPCLNFKRPSLSFWLQRMLELHVPVLNMIAHNNQAKIIAYWEGNVFMIRREMTDGLDVKGSVFVRSELKFRENPIYTVIEFVLGISFICG